MHPRVAFREYHRQFRKLVRIERRAFILTHTIFVRHRGRPIGLMTLHFLQDDHLRPYIVLDRARVDDDIG